MPLLLCGLLCDNGPQVYSVISSTATWVRVVLGCDGTITPPPPPLARATPLSEQKQVLFPQILEYLLGLLPKIMGGATPRVLGSQLTPPPSPPRGPPANS